MKHLRDDVMTPGSVLDWIEEQQQQQQPQQRSSSREKSEVESSSDCGFD